MIITLKDIYICLIKMIKRDIKHIYSMPEVKKYITNTFPVDYERVMTKEDIEKEKKDIEKNNETSEYKFEKKYAYISKDDFDVIILKTNCHEYFSVQYSIKGSNLFKCYLINYYY